MGYDLFKSVLYLIKQCINLAILLTNCGALDKPLSFPDLGFLLCKLGE